MSYPVDLTIQPSEKYHRVVGGYGHPDGPELPDTETTDAKPAEEWPDEHREAADGYLDVVASTPDPEDVGIEADEIEPLQWKHISPSSDPDLLAKIATYFDGMSPSEPSDRLRAKCRLLPVEVYADAQVAAREELRE